MRIVTLALLVLVIVPAWASEPGQPLDCSDWVFLEEVGQTLGHKDVQTNRRVYARIDEGVRRWVSEIVTREL